MGNGENNGGIFIVQQTEALLCESSWRADERSAERARDHISGLS